VTGTAWDIDDRRSRALYACMMMRLMLVADFGNTVQFQFVSVCVSLLR
jgi:hypothetical protein